MTRDNAPVIAVFARLPEAGKVKTRIARLAGDDFALRLHVALLNHLLQELCAARLAAVQLWLDRPLSHALPPELRLPAGIAVAAQQGRDLGQRMLHCFESLQGSGPRPVVIVGADCPYVDEAYLTAALNSLQTGHDLVLGPASDGGYVLIACCHAQARWFSGIEWGTGAVLKQSLARCEQQGSRCFQLSQSCDVDEVGDLRYLAEQGPQALRALARQGLQLAADAGVRQASYD